MRSARCPSASIRPTIPWPHRPKTYGTFSLTRYSAIRSPPRMTASLGSGVIRRAGDEAEGVYPSLLSSPPLTVEPTVLDRLGDVGGCDTLLVLEIGDRARHAEHAVERGTPASARMGSGHELKARGKTTEPAGASDVHAAVLERLAQ